MMCGHRNGDRTYILLSPARHRRNFLTIFSFQIGFLDSAQLSYVCSPLYINETGGDKYSVLSAHSCSQAPIIYIYSHADEKSPENLTLANTGGICCLVQNPH